MLTGVFLLIYFNGLSSQTQMWFRPCELLLLSQQM